jgi:hypothetical protein
MFDPKQYFRTSKGLRHRSQIHVVKGGSHVRRSGTIAEVRPAGSKTWQAVASPAAEAQAQGGWISWTEWENTTQDAISSFCASWVVPPAPSAANGQLIYLFDALMDANDQHILQPVLQWGVSPAQGSGNAWGLASFWVGQATDPMFCTEWVPVAPGTQVTGRMTVAAQDDGLFACTCVFDGYGATELTAEDLPVLTDCSLTLEAYDIGPTAPYPNVSGTDFSALTLITGATTPTVSWTLNGGATVRPGGIVEVAYPAAAM